MARVRLAPLPVQVRQELSRVTVAATRHTGCVHTGVVGNRSLVWGSSVGGSGEEVLEEAVAEGEDEHGADEVEAEVE